MTDFDRIDNTSELLVTKIFEPEENQLLIEVCTGGVSKIKEDLSIQELNLGPVNRVIFEDTFDNTYFIYFDGYISYFVLDASYDLGITGDFSGNRIREYKNSAFIKFCKAETLGFQIYDEKELRHYVIVSARHIINVLTIRTAAG